MYFLTYLSVGHTRDNTMKHFEVKTLFMGHSDYSKLSLDTVHGAAQFLALYGANDRSPRIRANTGEFARIRREFARVRRLFANFLFPRTLANDWRTLGELPRTLAEFARIRANSRGVRRELANSSPEKHFYSTF